MGPALLLVGAAVCLGTVVYVRRRRGLSAAMISTLAMVLLMGALIGAMVVSADTTCTCSVPDIGTTLGISTSGDDAALGSSALTPYTGTDLPWITAGLLIAGGLLTVLVARLGRGTGVRSSR